MTRKPAYEELEQRVKELEREVAEHRQADEVLRKSEKQASVAIEAARGFTFSYDIATSKIEWGGAIEEITGYTPKEFANVDIDGWAERIHPDDRDRILSILQQAFERDRATAEYRFRTKKGDYVTLSSISLTEKDEKGKAVRLVGILQDMTERKRMEEGLRESEQRLRSLFDTMAEGVVLIAPDGQIVQANPAAEHILGIKRSEIEGHNYVGPEWEILRPDGTPMPPDEMAGPRAMKEKRRIRDVEMGVKHQDGSTSWISVSAAPLIDRAGKFEGVVGTFTDITERKQAEEEKRKFEAQLSQAQKVEAIGTLAGGIAHNFNNLLTSIMGNTSLMLLETDPDHPNYEKLKIIEKQAQSGAKLTSQLLGYAREGGYEIKPISLNQLVKETSNTFGNTKKEITVHRELAKGLFGVKADQGQIEQVLLNLYVNAADAMPRGGDLFLKTMNVTDKDITGKPYEAKPGNYVLLSVTDTGVGMDKKTRKRVFDPFFTTKGMGRGTGLGLASVYGIVKAHGGYIDVESKKRHGTTFSIYLPASHEKGLIKEKRLPEKTLKGKEAILLVDDEDIVLDVGEEMLKALGYKALLAKSGKEAIELYNKNLDNIDMVLLDMVMPDMGGGETYDRMKDINPDIKVLLLSGYSIEGQATEILKRGCNGFIQKPFDMKELSQRVREILDKG